MASLPPGSTGSVTILHNGLRERVTFDRSKPLLAALQQYCSKYGLDAGMFVLMSGKVAADLNTPFQFSAIPNNAVLELAPRAGGGVDPRAVEVKVAVMLPSGVRLDGSFWAASTVADVILSFIRSGQLVGYDESVLVATGWEGVSVVYVRTTIKSADLPTTTLAALGLSKGTGMLRLNLPPPHAIGGAVGVGAKVAALDAVTPSAPVTPVPDAGADAIPPPMPAAPLMPPASSAEPPAPLPPAWAGGSGGSEGLTPPSLAKRARQETLVSSEDDAMVGAVTAPPLVASHPFPAPAPPVVEGGNDNPLRTAAAAARKGVDRLRATAYDADAEKALKAVVTILDNLVKCPMDATRRTLRYGNAKFHDVVGRHGGCLAILRAVGFADATSATTGEPVLELSPAREDAVTVEVVRDVVAGELRSMGVPVDPAPVVDAAAVAQAAAMARAIEASFDPYKPAVTRVGAAAGVSGGVSGAGAPSIQHTMLSSTAAPTTTAVSGGVGAGVVAGDDSDEGMGVLTSAEVKVRDLRAKAAEIQASHRPASRDTRVILFDPAAVALMAPGGGAGGGGGGVGDGEEEGDRLDPEAQRMLLEYARKKMAELTAENPMKTKALKELESLQSSKVYTATTLRIELPDRTTIKGTFSPLDTLADVYAWLRGLFTEEATSFFLYTTPPTVQHADTRAITLTQAKMVPSKLIRLGWGARLGAAAVLSASAMVPTAGGGDNTAPATTSGAGAIVAPAYLKPDIAAAAIALAGGDDTAFLALEGGAKARGAMGHATGVDLMSYGTAPGAAVSEEELEAMTRRMLAGENPFAPAPATSATGAGGAAVPRGRGGGGGGKPGWLRI